MLFLYGKQVSDENAVRKAFQFLQQLNPEKNNIINTWAAAGITAQSAYDTQALLHLRKEYCDKRKCIHCAIGHKIMNLKQ